jgi:hypothetical protein
MWYSASLFFEGAHQVSPRVPSTWEEVIVLIEADDEAQARQRADEVGRSREHEYLVSEPVQHRLRWRFVKTERVQEIEGGMPSNGVALFSRFLRKEEAESLLLPFE